jgi:hypothetical protein
MKKIYIATIHWQSDYWIDIQSRYFEKFVAAPYAVFACLNGIEVAPHQDKFDYINTDEIKDHGTKLNLLAEKITSQADDDDLIMFVDGDAFPIADINALADKYMPQYPLLAVQRKENLGDMQPHPCFCLTSVKFWKTIKGDWQKGSYTWKNAEGRDVNDVGGTLLKILDEGGIDWLPLNRTNQLNLHPVMFGIYHDVVYHHGMGFRRPASRIDRLNSPGFDQRRNQFEAVKKFLPLSLSKKLFSPYNKIIKINSKLNKKVLHWINSDPAFYKRFM